MPDTQSDQQPWDQATRNTVILSRYLKGETLQVIAASVSLTPERVRQIVRQAGLTVADHGRGAAQAKASSS